MGTGEGATSSPTVTLEAWWRIAGCAPQQSVAEGVEPPNVWITTRDVVRVARVVLPHVCVVVGVHNRACFVPVNILHMSIREDYGAVIVAAPVISPPIAVGFGSPCTRAEEGYPWTIVWEPILVFPGDDGIRWVADLGVSVSSPCPPTRGTGGKASLEKCLIVKVTSHKARLHLQVRRA